MGQLPNARLPRTEDETSNQNSHDHGREPRHSPGYGTTVQSQGCYLDTAIIMRKSVRLVRKINAVI
jgi:hypothetical protein